MVRIVRIHIPALLAVSIFLTAIVPAASAQGTAFIYNGQLTKRGHPAQGKQDLCFGLFGSPTNGTQLATQSAPNTPVKDGRFTVTLDFGAGAFNGEPRWLEISVKNQQGKFIALKPRQRFMPTPYAIMANSASNLLGKLPASQLTGPLPPALFSGSFPAPLVFSNAANRFAGDGGGLTGVNATSLNGISATKLWRLGGNSSTLGTDFLGTSDNQPLEFRVNNFRALRIAPCPSGIPSLIGGGQMNGVADGIAGATISGGGAAQGDDGNFIESDFASIGGGAANQIQPFAEFGSIGGGYQNRIMPGYSPFPFTIGYSTIGGGTSNTVMEGAAALGGGIGNRIGSDSSRFVYSIHTIGGGRENVINYDNNGATISGGSFNFVDESHSTIGGGRSNSIYWANCTGFTISGGMANQIWAANGCSISGGEDNAAGRFPLSFSGGYAAIGGGQSNTTEGAWSVIPGGFQNAAIGDNTFAAGTRAHALHDGSFVWADRNDVDFTSVADDSFAVRSVGGARFVSAVDSAGAPTAGVDLPSGGGSWASLSDRNAKENVTPVDTRAVLARVSQMPISTWNYKSQNPSVRHMGPMAQDFAVAFQVGESDRRITTVDADGVALAAIQGLNQIVKEKDAEIQGLKQRLERLEKLMSGKMEGQK